MEVLRHQNVSKFFRIRIVQVNFLNFTRDCYFGTEKLIDLLKIRYRSNGKQRTKNGIFSSVIVFSILAMTIIFGGLLYVFMSGGFSDTTSNNKPSRNSTRKQIETIKNVTDKNVGLEVIEITGKNFSNESHAKRIKRLDSEDDSSSGNESSPDSQKLIFYPSRTLKPPRIVQRPKVVHYPALPPNHKISSRRIDPRVYQFSTLQSRPHEFLRPPTSRSFYGNQLSNIQDVITNQHNHHPAAHLLSSASEMVGAIPIQLAGSYRHPRTDGNLAQYFQQSTPQTLKAEVSDPFRNYKPASPAEINQMLNQHMNDENLKYMGLMTSDAPYFRRKFRKKASSVAQTYDNHVNEASVLGNAVQTNKKRVDVHRELQSQGKPFSVMLDVYPMPGEENEYAQPYYRVRSMKRIKPLLNRYYQDPQMFDGINFPQVMSRYHPAYFHYQNNGKQQPQQYSQQASSHYGTIQNNGMMKPSQLVVHLNLYPKNNPTFKRSSSEDLNGYNRQPNHQVEYTRPPKVNLVNKKKNQTVDVSSTPFNINVNVHTGNGHPENIAHQKLLEFNRTSTEATVPQNYFYDDEDEDDGNEDFTIHPSFVYKDINRDRDVYRDRPIQLMLKSTTPSSTKKPKTNKYEKFEKAKNLKFHYQTIDRPKQNKWSSSGTKQKSFAPFFK